MATFSEIFRALRIEKGLTQPQLADILGLNSKQTISDYENEKSQPNIELLVKIAKYFDVSTDYLLGVSCYRNYSEQKIADVSEQKEALCPYSQSVAIEIYRQIIECISMFEKYYYQNDLRNNREPYIRPGVGEHLFSELQARIKAYKSVADYLLSDLPLSSIIYKYAEMVADADNISRVLFFELSKWFGV